MATNKQRKYEAEIRNLREEKLRLILGMLALQTPVAEGQDPITIQRDALIEAFCSLVSDGDPPGWVRDCLIEGMVPSIANHRARLAEQEARDDLAAACNFLSRLRGHLQLPPGIPRYQDAPDIARISAEYQQEQGARWMKEAALLRADEIVSGAVVRAVVSEFDPAKVCVAARATAKP